MQIYQADNIVKRQAHGRFHKTTKKFILQLSGKENQPSLQKHKFPKEIAERQKKRFFDN